MAAKEIFLQKAAEHLSIAKKSRPDKMTETSHREKASRLITNANLAQAGECVARGVHRLAALS